MSWFNITTKFGHDIPEIQHMVARFGAAAVAAGLLTPVIHQEPAAAQYWRPIWIGDLQIDNAYIAI